MNKAHARSLLDNLTKLTATPSVTVALDDDDMLDRMNAAYWVEYDRWGWRRKLGKDGFELFRISEDRHAEVEITNLTKRECHDKHDAESWYKTFATRTAMRKALEALVR